MMNSSIEMPGKPGSESKPKLCVQIPGRRGSNCSDFDDYLKSSPEGSFGGSSFASSARIQQLSDDEQQVPSILQRALMRPTTSGTKQCSTSCDDPAIRKIFPELNDEEEEMDVDINRPKYNLEAIKNYPPFRDAYNAVRARSSFGTGARQRSSSESCSVKCTNCSQVLTSKCLVQRCASEIEQIKCKACHRELTTRCLLSICCTKPN